MEFYPEVLEYKVCYHKHHSSVPVKWPKSKSFDYFDISGGVLVLLYLPSRINKESFLANLSFSLAEMITIGSSSLVLDRLKGPDHHKI